MQLQNGKRKKEGHCPPSALCCVAAPVLTAPALYGSKRKHGNGRDEDGSTCCSMATEETEDGSTCCSIALYRTLQQCNRVCTGLCARASLHACVKETEATKKTEDGRTFSVSPCDATQAKQTEDGRTLSVSFVHGRREEAGEGNRSGWNDRAEAEGKFISPFSTSKKQQIHW